MASSSTHQDWDPVVFHKRPQSEAERKDAAAVTAARRAGVPVDVQNKRPDVGASRVAAKVDAETEQFRHQRVSSELKTQIARARAAKGMTQQQLAQAINEKVQVVQDLERGNAIMSGVTGSTEGAVLSKMSRVLGVRLSRKG